MRKVASASIHIYKDYSPFNISIKGLIWHHPDAVGITPQTLLPTTIMDRVAIEASMSLIHINPQASNRYHIRKSSNKISYGQVLAAVSWIDKIREHYRLSSAKIDPKNLNSHIRSALATLGVEAKRWPNECDSISSYESASLSISVYAKAGDKGRVCDKCGAKFKSASSFLRHRSRCGVGKDSDTVSLPNVWADLDRASAFAVLEEHGLIEWKPSGYEPHVPRHIWGTLYDMATKSSMVPGDTALDKFKNALEAILPDLKDSDGDQ